MPEGDGKTRERKAAPAPRSPLVMPLQHFYRTASLPCPYIAGRTERKLVTELAGREAATFYNDLSRAGFRRSHHLAYRPACIGCAACVPVRIPVADFVESRSLRRIRRIDRDLVSHLREPRATPEQYRLFARYQRSRHADSDMAAMSFGDYRAMVEDSPVDTALCGIPSYSASFGSWATTRPDFSLTALSPSVPSVPVPESTTHTARSAYSSASE